MIAPVMVFLLVVSAVVGIAARAGEEGLRRLGWPSRWVWLPALAAGPTLLALSAAGLRPRAGDLGGAGGAGLVPVVELPGLLLGGGPEGGGWLAGLDPFLGALWLAASVALAATLLRAHRRLHRERGTWVPERILGHEVLVSRDRGPAVGGMRAPWVVVPRWALELPEGELRLVLAHEEEHRRAADPLLLSLALGVLTATPWNPVAWWQLRRLRTAMEVDCDARVLARHPDRRGYGASLLSVASRASGPSLALAAFSERSTSLEERILTMTRTNRRWTKPLGALLVVVAVLAGVQACGVDDPLAPEGDDAPAVQAPVPDAPSAASDGAVRDGPTFTPFTIAPSIRNRQEVVDAMEAAYPRLLREAGVEGTTRVYFFVDAEGVVRDARLDRSSGHEALDQAALAVAEVFEFSPARNGDEPVPVWVSFPITFQTR